MRTTELTIASVRTFNRAWTEVLELIGRGFLETEYSLTEARLILELAQRDEWERIDLRARLDLDESYLTRLLNTLEHDGQITQAQSKSDGRCRVIALTAKGRKTFETLNRRAVKQIADLMSPLTRGQQHSVVDAMGTILQTIAPPTNRSVIVRPLRSGDLGWVIQRHGEIYFDEFGWNQEFEALVAQILVNFTAAADQAAQNAWIAQVDGVRAGCIFCCHEDKQTALLRVLLVEPWARNLGIGRSLVRECTEFAKRSGYSTLLLWTNDVLTSASGLYASEGFELIDETPHHSFGVDLIGQTWRLALNMDPG